MKQLYDLKKKQSAMQKALAEEIIEADAGEGSVVVEMTGEQKLQSIKLSQALIDSGNKERIESLIEEAVKKAIAESQKVAAEVGKKFFSDLGLPGF